MSEEEKKDREGMAIGRILGVIAKKRPDLYEKLKRHMELYGVKATDLIVEALDTYTDFAEFSAVDLRSLFASLKLLERIGAWMFETMGNYLRLIASVTYAPMEEEKEEREEVRKMGVPPEVRAKIIESFTPLLTTLLSTIVSSLSNLITSMSQRQAGMPVQPPIAIPRPDAVMPKIVVGKKPKEQDEADKEDVGEEIRH